MFTQEIVDKVLLHDRLPPEVQDKLLTLYVGEATELEWSQHAANLFQRLTRKHGEDQARQLVKKAVAFAILLPAFDRSTKIDEDHPQNLLFWGMSYHQFNQRDWFDELKKVIRRDQQITEWRKEALSLGVIDPIDYQPYCRQAYKWLCGKADEDGVLTPEVKTKFRQLVMVYGGAVISNMFENHQSSVKRIVNWRSGYFFERAIFNVYSLEQVLKIKGTELEKTNSKWIKQIKNREAN